MSDEYLVAMSCAPQPYPAAEKDWQPTPRMKRASASSRLSVTPPTPAESAQSAAIVSIGPPHPIDCITLRESDKERPRETRASPATPAVSEPTAPAAKGRRLADEASAVDMPNW